MDFAKLWKTWQRRSAAFADLQLLGHKARQRLPLFIVPRLEHLEDRVTPTGDITITSVSLVIANGQPITSVNSNQQVYFEAGFTTQNLPSNASCSTRLSPV